MKTTIHPIHIAGTLRKSFLSTILLTALAAMITAQTIPQALTNADVIAMFKGGLGETTIINAIQSQDTAGYNYRDNWAISSGGSFPARMPTSIAATARELFVPAPTGSSVLPNGGSPSSAAIPLQPQVRDVCRKQWQSRAEI